MSGHHPVVNPVNIDGKSLTLEEVLAVAREDFEAAIETATKDRLDETSKTLIAIVKKAIHNNKRRKEIAAQKESETEPENELSLKQEMMYGTTTGFGDLKTKTIDDLAMAIKLQTNIILSHASGVGPSFDRKTTRAIMLLRANTLASGYCGVRFEVVRQLVNMLKHDIYPVIPEQGSVGASGDLAPLAHLALGLIGRGPVKRGEKETEEFFVDLAHLLEVHPELKYVEKDRESGVQPGLELSYKEGLALVNGITVMTGVGALAYADAANLVDWADVLGAVTLESLLGSSRAFDEIVFTVYGHQGAQTSAKIVRDMIKGSGLINRSTDVHDAYSIRCIPQVHGAVRDALGYVKTTIKNQLNSVDDDPIIFGVDEIDKWPAMDFDNPPKDSNDRDTDKAKWKERQHFEQGNFHGEPVAFAMDLLAIVTAELGSISERRIQMLLDGHHNRGLPACLVDNPDGVNSGYMIAQYAAAALVSENKGLCHPASVDSIPTSANSEDHVSMGTIAARKARKVIENVRNILAIELLCSTEALSYRLFKDRVWLDKDEEKEANRIKPKVKGECGNNTRRVYDKVRSRGGVSVPSEPEQDASAFKVPLLNGKDVLLYKLIDQARENFLSKKCSEVFEWLKESTNGTTDESS